VLSSAAAHRSTVERSTELKEKYDKLFSLLMAIKGENIRKLGTFSLAASNAEVASSSSRTAGFLIKALAMAIRCFCPPLTMMLP
jgi:hypothetical protein